MRSIVHNENDCSGIEIADILEKNLISKDTALKELDLYNIQELIQIMEACEQLERERLLFLEFQLIAAFGRLVAESALELQRELIENPDQLLFAISKAYKPDIASENEVSNEEERWAEVCHNLLHYTKLTPGLQRVIPPFLVEV